MAIVCYGENDHVPLAPGDECPVSGTELELSTSDGNSFPAYLAIPDRPTGPPIVLLPDAGGLDPFYRELARRFARLGQPTLAIEYYGRTASSPERDASSTTYSWTGELGREPALPDEFVAGVRRPVLGLFGDADAVIPIAVPHAFDEHLDEAGVPHEIVIYPGAPHGFFERHYLDREVRPDTVDDVWRRLNAFFALTT